MTLTDHRKRPLRTAGLLLFALTCWVGAFAQGAGQPPADNEYIAGAVLWQQTSGERRALSYQAFALARLMLDRDLRMNRGNKKPRAVIVDVDETILDNSPAEGKLLQKRVNFNSKDWTEWINLAQAEAVPGSVEFLRYASSRGVRVFYITNRNENQKAGTAANLKKMGFPNVNDLTLLVQTDPKNSSKEPRRQSVGAKYRIVLLMGDDLNDFSEVFEKSKTVADRVAAANQYQEEFGKRFIMLPNAMYGNWETAIYGSGSRLSEAEKTEKRKSVLKGY